MTIFQEIREEEKESRRRFRGKKVAEISILVPVYNVERYVRACLDSILAQSFTDFEVICIDDGSTDSSGVILDEYAYKDSRIKVIHKRNSGYGHTMNVAMKMAEGNYIGIVESDDTIEKDMIQTLYEFVSIYNLDMVKTDFYLVWYGEKNGREVRRQYTRLTENQSMYDRVIDPNLELESYLLEKFTWNALYKREMIIKNNIRYNETPGASYQDNGFWFQTFYWAKRVMFLGKSFYNYRQDNMSASSHSKQKVYAMKSEFDFIRDFMIAHQDNRKELYKICFHLRMMAYLFTLSRIDLSLKQEFARTIERECQYFEQQGEACYDWLDEAHISILKNPVKYVDEVAIGCRELEKAISEYPNIIVYGAGIYGERAVIRLHNCMGQNQTLRVAVTSLGGKTMRCQGESVCEITDCIGDRETGLVILAVKEETDAYQEMRANLKRLQFKNVISISARSI